MHRRRVAAHVLVVAAVAAAVQVWLLAAPQGPSRLLGPPTAAEVEPVLAAYAGGDDRAVERWMSTRRFWSYESVRDLEDLVRGSRLPRRTKAAFVLEILVAHRDWISVRGLPELGRSIVADGAKSLGVDPAEDQFEVLWHETAIAAVQGRTQFAAVVAHLDEIRPRFEEARRRGVEPRTRFLLARAIAAAGLCCWEQGEFLTTGGTVMFSSRRPTGTREAAILLFEQAAKDDALRVEALIRGAVLLHQGGREAKAREWFDRVPPHGDILLGYVQHLTHGRVLDALDLPAEAAVAYARALDSVPGAQTAEIGLAAALLRSGRAEEAVAVARSAKEAGGSESARLTFHLADARFLPQWLAEIRRLK